MKAEIYHEIGYICNIHINMHKTHTFRIMYILGEELLVLCNKSYEESFEVKKLSL